MDGADGKGLEQLVESMIVKASEDRLDEAWVEEKTTIM
jgi:hypothetical protein